MLILALESASQAVAAAPVSESISAADQLLKVTVVLGAMVACIYAVAWLIRRHKGLSKFIGMPIKTLAVSPIGPKEKLALIEVGGRQLLIGITPNSINTLAEFPEPIIEVKDKAETDFAKKLKDILSHGRAD